ncbi:hypothetical protein K438DRAFT_2151265 [Mycena galopus ATCC 62051]|nr:hypothetical protein K438DRAFT_2151265 [Mycena galopus ATCC 62051]
MKLKFVRGTRLTAMGLLTLDGMMANRVVEGSTKCVDYLDFIEHEVMPLTSAFPGPLSVLVMDNARIHHGKEILELAEHFSASVSLALSPLTYCTFRCSHRISTSLFPRLQHY